MLVKDIAIEQAEYFGYEEVTMVDIQNDGKTYVMHALKPSVVTGDESSTEIELVAEVGDLKRITYEDGGFLEVYFIELYERVGDELVYVDRIEYEAQ